MNRLQYRIVFNKQRGQLMAVAETALSHVKGGSAGESSGPAARAPASAETVPAAPRGPPSLLALAAAFAMGAVITLAPEALAQVKADPNAPKGQQPTVVNSANGTVQVNIQTPSAAGVSRNTYSQFDVDKRGVILNNARSDVSTQLGGFVQGNPWLAKGSARVILNEVNSSAPSQLKGYVEVAGQRAEVVIANPSGIQVDGAGFINASAAVLTTGTARFNADGSIAGYGVQGVDPRGRAGPGRVVDRLHGAACARRRDQRRDLGQGRPHPDRHAGDDGGRDRRRGRRIADADGRASALRAGQHRAGRHLRAAHHAGGHRGGSRRASGGPGRRRPADAARGRLAGQHRHRLRAGGRCQRHARVDGAVQRGRAQRRLAGIARLGRHPRAAADRRRRQRDRGRHELGRRYRGRRWRLVADRRAVGEAGRPAAGRGQARGAGADARPGRRAGAGRLDRAER
ncbi:filamentous hemagglutinin N-terminal domain-containing protein [Roseateles chitinivorans]|uniref:two-partner secretion domain-containing protein n=1 Tax=Roseateles chitinivorans TaxID=2917965 RepID=UPI003D66A464